jgi:hypothetical protein
MPHLTVTTRDGESRIVEARAGLSVMEIIRDAALTKSWRSAVAAVPARPAMSMSIRPVWRCCHQFVATKMICWIAPIIAARGRGFHAKSASRTI